MQFKHLLTPSTRNIFFFFNDPPPPEIYPLPLHDALPICAADEAAAGAGAAAAAEPPAVGLTAADVKGITAPSSDDLAKGDPGGTLTGSAADIVMADRSEEHTSELQSRLPLVCRLLLVKKK